MSCTGFDGSLGVAGSEVAELSRSLAASYTEVKTAKDVNVSVSADKADLSNRKSSFKMYASSMIDCEITATIAYDSSETILDTIRTACLARTAVEVGIFDGGVTSGSAGIAFTAYVFSSDIAQPLTDGQTYSVTFAPASTGNEPSWIGLS